MTGAEVRQSGEMAKVCLIWEGPPPWYQSGIQPKWTFLTRGGGSVQTQAEERVQTQAETILPVRQDLRGFCLAGLSRL